MHLEVCASSGSAQRFVMGRTKWPATYTQYFALGMQLPPALQSLFSFHLECGHARKKNVPVSVLCKGDIHPHLLKWSSHLDGYQRGVGLSSSSTALPTLVGI